MLLRDLCTKIISYENFLHVWHKDSSFHPPAARNVRRLYIWGDLPSRSQFIETEEFGSHVYSIISDTHSWEFLFLRLGCNLLRVLDATKEGVTRFPAKILQLFHLRYLAVAVNEIPPSISLLQNLETLIIESDSWRTGLCLLPSQIWKMPNLKHIMSRGNQHFECQFFDERIVGEPSILKNLQTLSWVTDVKFTNKVIEIIPNLQILKVSCYQTAALEWKKFSLDNLFHLHRLETLNIYFYTMWRRKVIPLPESFSCPLTLKKLSLSGCKIHWKDMTVVGSLPNLQVLKLRNSAFVGEKWEPVEGEFPQLKFLLMERLGLMYWQAESTHFPTLQHLIISNCKELQEIPIEIGEISTLEFVEVGYSKLSAKSALKMQEEQRDMGNDVLQVRVY